MPVTIKINESSIRQKADNPLSERGMEMLCSQILADCNKFCKEDTGALIASSMIHSDLKHGKLIWQTPYAARQYYEIKTAYKDKNHNATWRWVEVADKMYHGQWGRQADAIARLYE
jgi:hypothetical protein